MTEKFARVTDRLGMPIDKGIQETVVVLNLLGFETTQSCEGHIDHGVHAPWIRFNVEEVKTILQQANQVNKQIDEQRKGKACTNEELWQLYAPYRALNTQAKTMAATIQERLVIHLDNFYQIHERNKQQKILIVYTDIPGTFVLESQGANLQGIQPADERVQRLQWYQEEMQAFTVFLKQKYFTQ